jgi:hypothetical protein
VGNPAVRIPVRGSRRRSCAARGGRHHCAGPARAHQEPHHRATEFRCSYGRRARPLRGYAEKEAARLFRRSDLHRAHGIRGRRTTAAADGTAAGDGAITASTTSPEGGAGGCPQRRRGFACRVCVRGHALRSARPRAAPRRAQRRHDRLKAPAAPPKWQRVPTSWSPSAPR